MTRLIFRLQILEKCHLHHLINYCFPKFQQVVSSFSLTAKTSSTSVNEWLFVTEVTRISKNVIVRHADVSITTFCQRFFQHAFIVDGLKSPTASLIMVMQWVVLNCLNFRWQSTKDLPPCIVRCYKAKPRLVVYTRITRDYCSLMMIWHTISISKHYK